MNISLRKLY